MKSKCARIKHLKICARPRRLAVGMTLVEMMIGLTIFAFMSVSITAGVIQMRKQAENTMCQTIANSMAEGMMAQVRRMGYVNLSDTSSSTSVELKFLGVSSANHAIIQTFDLDWAIDGSGLPDLTNYTEIGEMSGSVVRGILLDVDFKDNTTGVVIQPRRYMKMKINLTRTVDTGNGFVVIAMRYMWGQPDRRSSAGVPQYFGMRELRTVVSAIDTY